MFEAFPGPPGDPEHSGVMQLRTSLEKVIHQKTSDQMPLVRYDIENADGSFNERYWSAVNKPVLGKDGELLYILHTAEEMTSAVKAEASAKRIKNLEKSHNLFIQAPVAIGIAKGNDYVIELANDSLLEVWGRSAEEVMGRPVFDAVPILAGQGFKELLDQVCATGEPFFGYEHPCRIVRNGREELHYFDFVYKPYYEEESAKPAGVFTIGYNVTKQVLARRKVLESETKLRSILNSAPTAICVFVGPDLILENPNQLMIEVLSLGPDIEGKSFRNLLSGLVEEDQTFLHIIDTVRSSGKSFEAHETEVFFKVQNRTRYFNISFIPLLDENENVYAVLDVSVDVTEQVLVRKKLEESEGRFRLLADASPNLIWMLKPDGAYGYVNKTTLQFLNVTQEKIAAVGWEPFQHPEDLVSTTETLQAAIKAKRPYQMEHRMLHRDGDYRWVLSQAIPAYDASGNVFAYVGSSIDVDEAKRNRQELVTALEQIRLSKEAAELGTFDMDLEKGTMHWDDRCRTMFGIAHQNTVTYEHDFVTGLHPDDRERITKLIDDLFNNSIGNGEYDVEYRTVGAQDGVVRWVRAKGKVYFNQQDKPIRFIGSVIDITEKVMAIQQIEKLVEERTKELADANERLLQVNKELQRSNANLEEFAHAASHDLKEPIRKIHFFTHQLREQLTDRLNDSEIRSFSRVENASRRMGNLIDDLLLYSHVSQRPHETETVDLNEIVLRVLEDLDLDIEEKGATINRGNLPVVQGYRRQLQQVFQNLISNAIKYHKTDLPPTINIEPGQVERAGKQYHEIRVKDNGIGFAPEYAHKIFQMFTRLHGKAEYSGTGVGLSIVKKVVENHHGFTEVESEPGTGSTFKLYLPV